VARVDERVLEVLYPTPLPEFKVRFARSFREVVDSEVASHDPGLGMLAILADFDNTFRPRLRGDVLTGKFGRVREEDLDYGEEVNNLVGVDFGVWSDQPREGFQVAATMSLVHGQLNGGGYEYLPDCFFERGIFYSGARIIGGPVYDVAHKGSFEALVEVGGYWHGKHGFKNIAAIVGIDDRGPGIVALNKLHHHVYHNYGFGGEFRAYWIE